MAFLNACVSLFVSSGVKSLTSFRIRIFLHATDGTEIVVVLNVVVDCEVVVVIVVVGSLVVVLVVVVDCKVVVVIVVVGSLVVVTKQ